MSDMNVDWARALLRDKGLVLNDDATNGEEQMTTLNGRPATTISASACGELDDFWLAMPNIDGRDGGLGQEQVDLANVSDEEVFDLARAELARARARYPQWPADLVHAAAIASEESGEVVKACNEYQWKQGDATLADIRAEAVQAIAMWTRFLVGK